MVDRRRAGLLAGLLVLAGCSALSGAPTPDAGTTTATTATTTTTTTTAPTATPTTAAPAPATEATTTATPTTKATTTTTTLATPEPPGITVIGGSLRSDPGVVWARTAALVNRTDASPPDRVVVRNLSEMPTVSFDRRPFYDLFGLGRESGETRAAAYAIENEVVIVREQATSPQGVVTLAHEFVHVTQYGTPAFRDRGTTTEAALLERGVVEGAATYVSDAYARRFAPDRRAVDYIGTRYRNRTGARKLVVAPYWFGGQYYADRAGDPARVGAVYERPPNSTEEVIHGLAPGADPFEPPNVSIGGWTAGERDRMGELWLRMALTTGLNDSAAARGAAGWDGDRRFEVSAGSDGRAYAWAIRFDDRANATEFRTLFRRWLLERADREGALWRDGDDAYRVVRPSDRTVVVLAGTPTVVGEATVTGGDGGVTVARTAAQASTSGTAKTTSSPTSATTAPTPTSRAV